MNRKAILEAAMQCVCHDRQDQHGAPENTFAVIADLWEMFLAHRCGLEGNLTPADVAVMMTLFKAARYVSNPSNPDNYIDGAGYMALAGEMRE